MYARRVGIALGGIAAIWLSACSGGGGGSAQCTAPTVSAVVPLAICQGGSQMTVQGSGLASGMPVLLEAAGQAAVASTSTVASSDGKSLVATFPSGLVPGVHYDVVVGSGSCVDPAPPHQVTAVAGAVAYLADPDVAYNGINTRVTVYATALALPLPGNAVEVTPAGQAAPVTTLGWAAVPGHPNRVQVILPQGQAPGTYDLRLTDAVGCQTLLPDALRVTADLTVTVRALVPPFGDAASYTSVSVSRDASAPAPADKPFSATPRLFLNPTNPAAGDIAIPVQSVSFVDGDTLTAVIPPGQPPHEYDLVAVNPDGSVGLLANAFRVQATPPPVVASVTPSSIVAATGQAVTVAGTGFDATSLVSLECRDALGNASSPPVVTGAEGCSAGQCTLAATVDGSTLLAGDVCVLRVANGDGSYFDFSAIGVTNPSLNLSAPRVGTSLGTGRRALVAAAGNATASARFLYAIGGDGGAGAAASPFASVEVVPVDLYGNMGGWAPLQGSPLGTPRSFAGGVTVGRYVYVLGGSDGTGPLASAERAMILDPVEVPTIDVDDIAPSDAGLAPGAYVYRVAAVFDPGGPDNPGGESLASDELVIRVPSLQGKKLTVVLAVTPPADRVGAPIPNVVGYRVYRSPAAPGVSGDEVLIASPAAPPAGGMLLFTDDGTATPGTAKPLPLGSLGRWRALPSMGTPRMGPGAAAAPDPASPNVWYVYALLGKDTATTATGSYEYLPIALQPNGHQAVAAAWTPGASGSSTGRWQLGTWTVDQAVSSVVAAGDTWIYMGGGMLPNGTLSGKVEAGKVGAGGDLGALSDTPKDFASLAAGYGVCAANGQLFTFGGANGGPSSGATSAALIDPPPTLALSSWNNEGLTMTQSRYLMGSAVQSAFIFIVGGQTATSAAATSTELVIW
jgi:hypothetical protein